MKSWSKTGNPVIIRTDFSSQPLWEKLCNAVRKSYERQDVSVEFVDDIVYQGMSKTQLIELVPKDYADSFIMLADQTTFSTKDLPVLLVDLYDEVGREFRAIPSQISMIEANLSLANISFFEFADIVDKDGVFRGSSMPWHIRLFMKLMGMTG